MSVVLGVGCSSLIGFAQAALTTTVQADLDSVNAAGRIIYIAGADALQPMLTELTGRMFTGPVTRFADTSMPGASRGYEAALGVAAAGAGPWAGQKVLFIYRIKGGATAGIVPVAQNQSFESLSVTSTLCGAQGNGSALTPYNCPLTATGSGRVADAGVTDSAFTTSSFYMNLAGEGEVNPIYESDLEAFGFNTHPLFSSVEGIAVTNTVGGNLKLNRAAMTAIMAANVTTWNQVNKTEPAEDIVVCLHAPGSGTRTASNAYFNRLGCSGEMVPTPDRYSNEANADGTPKWDDANKIYTVKRGSGWSTYVENSSSDDVRLCLNAAVNGGSYITGDRSGNRNVQVNFVGSGHRAIGILPLSYLAYSTPTAAWQFRSIDGAGIMTLSGSNVATSGSGKFPTQDNHIDGTWDFTTIPFLNIPQRTTGAKRDFLNFLVKTAGDPALIASFSDLSMRLATAAIPERVRLTSGNPPPEPSGVVGSATNNMLSAEFINSNLCGVYTKNY